MRRSPGIDHPIAAKARTTATVTIANYHPVVILLCEARFDVSVNADATILMPEPTYVLSYGLPFQPFDGKQQKHVSCTLCHVE